MPDQKNEKKDKQPLPDRAGSMRPLATDRPIQPQRPIPKQLPQWLHMKRTGPHHFEDGTVSHPGDVIRCHKSKLGGGAKKFERYEGD